MLDLHNEEIQSVEVTLLFAFQLGWSSRDSQSTGCILSVSHEADLIPSMLGVRLACFLRKFQVS